MVCDQPRVGPQPKIQFQQRMQVKSPTATVEGLNWGFTVNEIEIDEGQEVGELSDSGCVAEVRETRRGRGNGPRGPPASRGQGR